MLGTIADMVGECIMTLLVLMLANGWYTRFQHFDYDSGLEVYGPLFILILMVHIVFGAFSFIDQDAYHKYHDFHGWVGYCLICAKFILFAVFFWFYDYTHDKLNKESKKFYLQFLPIGALYLLSDPLVILTSFFLEEYNRQYYYRFFDQSMHIAL